LLGLDEEEMLNIIRFDASVTVKFHCAGAPLNPLGTKTYPESNPPASCSQGAEKTACDTVWFPGLEGGHYPEHETVE
jgi:hypothetical protein